jgi:hypothetical protein
MSCFSSWIGRRHLAGHSVHIVSCSKGETATGLMFVNATQAGSYIGRYPYVSGLTTVIITYGLQSTHTSYMRTTGSRPKYEGPQPTSAWDGIKKATIAPRFSSASDSAASRIALLPVPRRPLLSCFYHISKRLQHHSLPYVSSTIAR